MRILFDNVDFSSNSGPNSFASKLAKQLIEKGHSVNHDEFPDVQLSFIMATQKRAPIIQRLDGIYFNTAQDWQRLNEPIKQTYESSHGVIFQSEFNKRLTEKFFGKRENFRVIHNGTNLRLIDSVPKANDPIFDNHENVWTCASSWRPHKRLSENIRYFLENSDKNDCLVVAGSNSDHNIKHDRVFYVGNLNWINLISLFKRSKYFLHLAFLDHCPNVVVDARAAGCHIVCSDSGGTKEIAGENATIIGDMSWELDPIQLYEPPKMDFSKRKKNNKDCSIDIEKVSENYYNFFDEVLS